MRHGVSNPCHVISLSVDPVTSSSSLSPVFLAYSDGSLVAAADITVCRTAAREQITRKVIHSEYSQNLERGTIAQNVPSHILSCFKIPSIRLFAMQCIKMHYNLRTMNPSLPTPKLRHCRPIHRFPKVHVHLQCPSSHQFRRIFQRFPDKNVVQKFSQTRNFKPKIIFAGMVTASPIPLLVQTSHLDPLIQPPELQSDWRHSTVGILHHWIYRHHGRVDRPADVITESSGERWNRPRNDQSSDEQSQPVYCTRLPPSQRFIAFLQRRKKTIKIGPHMLKTQRETSEIRSR